MRHTTHDTRPAHFDHTPPPRRRSWPLWVITVAITAAIIVFWGSMFGAGFLVGRWTS